MLRTWLVPLALLLALNLALTAVAQTAPAPQNWAGKRVMPKEGCVVALPDEVIDARLLTLPYTVEQSNGDWLWVNQGVGRKGWVKAPRVVLLEEAADYYTQLLENEKTIWAYNMRAIVHRERGQLDKAIEDCAASIELKPENPTAWRFRAIAYAKKKEYAKAIADFTKAIELEPNNATGYIGRGVLHELSQDFDQAIEDYDRALAIDPKNSRAFLFRGNALKQKGDLMGARVAYTEAIRRDRESGAAYVNRAATWLEGHEVAKAVDDLSHALKLPDGKVSVAYFNRGIAYSQRGDFAKAAEDFDRVVSLEPENARAFNNRGLARRKVGDNDKALSDFSMAIELDRNFAVALDNRAQIYLERGEYEHAREDLRAAMKAAPDLVSAMVDAAWLMATCPDKDFRNGKRAEDLARKAVEATSQKNARALAALAAALAERGSFDDAQKYQAKALQAGFTDSKQRAAAEANLELFRQEKPLRLTKAM